MTYTETQRQTAIMAIARTYPGWNEDITEPDIADPKMRIHMEAKWQRINQQIIDEATKYVDIVLNAIGEKA